MRDTTRSSGWFVGRCAILVAIVATSGFENVDSAPDPAALLAYLDTATALGSVQAYKRQTFALLDLRPGMAVLDVGCGTGDDARALAAQVGRSGRVVGLDSSETAVAEARRRSDGDELPVEFQVGDAHVLPFAADTFDAVRSDRVLQHVADPARALAELVRVTRTDRPVVVMDADWDTLVVDAPDRAVTRAVLRAHADAVPNGWIGRQLRGLFVTAGLRDVLVVPVAAAVESFALARQILRLPAAVEGAVSLGVIGREQGARWLASLEEADREGRFFAGLTGYIAAGRKPERSS
jgi:ubiquinone/menaquinone biosynthesis C-methylase UbiE